MPGTAAQNQWVERVLGFSLSGVATPGRPPAADRPAIRRDSESMRKWLAARTTAIASLSALERAIRLSEHPQADRAIIILRAVRANLTATPETPQQVRELRDFVATSDVVAATETPNVFGITVTLRRPLLAALGGFEA